MDQNQLESFPTLSSFKTKKKEQNLRWIKDKISYDEERKGKPLTFDQDTSFYDCRLFPWQHMSVDFHQLYTKAVLDLRMKDDLERCGVLNWCQGLIMLEALAMPRDKNSLLHAVSMLMWSVADEWGTLHQMLLRAVTANNNSYRCRWWRQRLLELRVIKPESQLVQHEWKKVVTSLSSVSSPDLPAASVPRVLESVHIYVLANVLRRPIMVLARTDPRGEEGHITGLYLPLEWLPLDCCKTPLVLAYNRGHFCPLVVQPSLRGGQSNMLVPLVSRDMCSLPVRFLTDLEESRVGELVQAYCVVKEVNVMAGGAPVPCAVLQQRPLHTERDVIQQHFQACEQLAQDLFKHRLHVNSQTSVVGPSLLPSDLAQTSGTCVTQGCAGEGSMTQANLCNACLKKYTIAEAGGELVSTQAGQRRSHALKHYVSTPGIALSMSDLEATLPQPEVPMVVPTAPLATNNSSLALSMMDERCRNGCGYRCSRLTYPYCHECSNLANQPTLPVCARSNDINHTHSDLIVFSPAPSVEAVDPSTNKAGPGLDWETSRLPFIAQIPYSEPRDVYTEQSFGETMILRPAEPSKTAMAEQEVTIKEEEVEVSAEVAAPVSCASPFCGAYVRPPAQLCQHCQDVLRRGNAGKAKARVAQETMTPANPRKVEGGKAAVKPGQRGKYCITSGCRNYGDRNKAYMCNTCHQLSLQQYEKLQRKCVAQTSEVCNAQAGPAVLSSRTGHQGSTLRCEPLAGASMIQSSRLNHSLENLATSSEAAYPGNSFNHKYDKMQDQLQAGLRRCKLPNCTNFGNATKGGYCNACHSLIRFERYGEDVPDSAPNWQNSI